MNGVARAGDSIEGYITNYNYGSHVQDGNTIQDYANITLTGELNDNGSNIKINNKSIALVGDPVTVWGYYTDYQNKTQILYLTGYISNGKSTLKAKNKEVAYVGCNIITTPSATSCYISSGSSNVLC